MIDKLTIVISAIGILAMLTYCAGLIGFVLGALFCAAVLAPKYNGLFLGLCGAGGWATLIGWWLV